MVYSRLMHKKSLPKETVSKKPASSKNTTSTSWGGVASWYDTHLEKSGDTYHEKVVYPNLLRILGAMHGKRILDLACGQGQFSRLLESNGASVVGVDLGKELIALAEKHGGKQSTIVYHATPSHDLYMLKDASFDVVVCILALQNIEKLQETLKEVSRVLVSGGRFIAVLNHPVFRNPRKTKWGYDEAEKLQYRRIDEYMSESHVKIDMTPGSASHKKFTVSFHRPLQVYMKALFKHGFLISRFEEWVSHKESEPGPKKSIEDNSRKEIPLFLCVEACKIAL